MTDEATAEPKKETKKTAAKPVVLASPQPVMKIKSLHPQPLSFQHLKKNYTLYPKRVLELEGVPTPDIQRLLSRKLIEVETA